METHPTVNELLRDFSTYLERVAHHGESFVLMEGNKPVAELRPVSQEEPLLSLREMFESLPRLTPAEAEDFAADLEAIRNDPTQRQAGDPWDS